MTEKSYIEELITRINNSSEFFVIAKKAGYLVVGTVMNLKVRIEKSGNIFQPFGKNFEKLMPLISSHEEIRKLHQNEKYEILKFFSKIRIEEKSF